MSRNLDPADDILAYNREAWDSQVRKKNRWTVPVSSEEIQRARDDDWRIVLTPEKHVPAEWFPNFREATVDVLCLAGSGGQQAPVLAAAGANVTVFDNSPAQLKQDQLVADREGLALMLVQGDMADLSVFENESFDLIVHPCSNCFVPNVLPVWKEAARVMKPGANLLSGIVNPVLYLFDDQLMERGEFKVCHKIPYSDLTGLSPEQRREYLNDDEPFCFGHTLADQLGGQIEAGLSITGMFEDRWSDWPISQHIPTFLATKATKLN
ncbi:Methyltransferase domain-containing protein [Neorhodopirellula lusitana]|uniref:Methyltransferase domain-containing protein n=1 Tax=Neorhodopirellula lusitana TaxID=445327 RepID=A0ABY1QLF2_9BACT|nr:class I SAM-dependent methyltransferase [Neorhodopirellula lusitana]SMP74417.1 Methyltransferase domain-containing protein [Neorhodopirellula lusitana]